MGGKGGGQVLAVHAQSGVDALGRRVRAFDLEGRRGHVDVSLEEIPAPRQSGGRPASDLFRILYSRGPSFEGFRTRLRGTSAESALRRRPVRHITEYEGIFCPSARCSRSTALEVEQRPHRCETDVAESWVFPSTFPASRSSPQSTDRRRRASDRHLGLGEPRGDPRLVRVEPSSGVPCSRGPRPDVRRRHEATAQPLRGSSGSPGERPRGGAHQRRAHDHERSRERRQAALALVRR